ncbi:restriction endonuclease subunit S [Acinetobacter gandensis]|uniref:restriction endonuclease subunit S n=1 Tax=Acinetobacter gandensis TaxID=1443941 RepID=UPI003F567E51
MSQLPRYESYKDSGVQWLGEIPSHWVRTNVKYYYDVQLGKMLQPEAKSVDDINIKYLKAQHVQWEKIDSENMPEMWCSSKELSKYMVSNGDLLICEGGEVGRCGILTNLEEPAIIQNALHRVRNTARADVRYLNYFIQHTAQSDWFSILCNKATIAHFTSEKLLALPTLIPPLDEQKIIADFLDKRLAQVDALIAKQETLLEKLAEQRVALISHAVTKGLNPDVEMKESGISWFKQIPKSWDVKQLKFVITKIQTGSTPPSAVPEYYSSDDIVWYGPADFTDENYILNESVKKISALALEDKVVKPMPKGSIMMIGIGATLGKVAITNVDCTTNQQINSLIPIEDVNAKYLMYQLNSLRDIVKLLSSASTLGIINQEKTKCLKIIVPSLNDQNEIVEFLDKELNEISAVKKSVEQTINKLKEYRSTLITQVVTGKIDVRNLKVN